MNEKLLSSKEIIDRAIAEYKPYAIVLMLSGGDDSMTALAVANYLNVPITHIMHGVTGTGIQETTDFVRKICEAEGKTYLEANAGNAYEKYVLRKGFFGRGEVAHKFSYHILKWTHFRRTISSAIRHKKRNRNILFVNSARRLESERRKITMANPIIVQDGKGPNIWVNIINEWEKFECHNFLDYLGIKRNPVSINLCRSGECMCGTMHSKGDRAEAGYFYPKWKQWVNDIEKAVNEKGFAWGWGEEMPKIKKPTAQMEMDFQPMCVGCAAGYEDQQTIISTV